MQPPCVLSKTNWPPDYTSVYQWRQDQILRMRANKSLLQGAMQYYAQAPASEFILHWMDTYDPRNASKPGRMARMPFVMFEKQAELLEFYDNLRTNEANGLIEKARDMGATWVSCAYSVYLWRFVPGSAIGWGSRKEQLVDKIGDPDSIFEKMRILLRNMPPEFLPRGFSEREHATYMRIVNPENGSTITGEAGDNIGRGGRKSIYFKDESAHYERPEKIEAALGDNTRVQIDISSVNGLGNVFHRRREAGIEWRSGQTIDPKKTQVFVMDWSDHPDKTQEWYDARRQKAVDDGLLHLFAQEVERNYASSVVGVLIPHEWAKAAVDAHLKLGFGDRGMWSAALDVADEGGDLNALAKRKGVVLKEVPSWGEGDTAKTTRRALTHLEGLGDIEVQYDCIGVGAGVKAEANNLAERDLLPEGIRFVPWNAGDSVQDPKQNLEEGDEDSPINEDFFHNFKAQAWWSLRRRFERTFKAVTQGETYSPDDMISISGDIPDLQTLLKELSQPTMTKSASMKVLVNKKPEGTRSPNKADAVAMCYFPKKDDVAVAAMFLRKRNAA